MSLIDFFNDKDGKREVAHGSDGRLNVSSRQDERIYYISRDEQEAYTLVFDDATPSAADYIVYLKNTNANGKHLVVHSVDVHSVAATALFRLIETTLAAPTGAGATALTAVCQNRAAPKSAAVTALGPTASGTNDMVVVEQNVIDVTSTDGSYGGSEFHLNDELRLGQDQAIAIEVDATASAVRAFGSIHFYFE